MSYCDVVADVEIEPAVAVVVEKGRRHPPAGAVGAAGSGHVGEGAVAVVLYRAVLAEKRQVEIDAAVVVEVAGGDAHPVAARVDAALLGDVGEVQGAGPVGS